MAAAALDGKKGRRKIFSKVLPRNAGPESFTSTNACSPRAQEAEVAAPLLERRPRCPIGL